MKGIVLQKKYPKLLDKIILIAIDDQQRFLDSFKQCKFSNEQPKIITIQYDINN